MKMLLTADRRKLLSNGETSAETGETATDCVVKYFDCMGRYTFYAFDAQAHGDSGDLSMFGYCVSPHGPDCDEWGSVLLSELESLRRIERDMYFDGVTREELSEGKRP